MPKRIVALTVNGRRREDAVDDATLLLDHLREQLALTGTKRGCDGGECGGAGQDSGGLALGVWATAGVCGAAAGPGGPAGGNPHGGGSERSGQGAGCDPADGDAGAGDGAAG